MRTVCFYIVLILLATGCVSTEEFYLAAPSEIQATDFRMKTPGFWIARNSSPDDVILNPQEIKDFNAVIQNNLTGLFPDNLNDTNSSSSKKSPVLTATSVFDKEKVNKLTKDIFSFPETMSGVEFKSHLQKALKEFQDRPLFNAQGNLAAADPRFYQQITAQTNASMVPEAITPEYGLVVHYADQRFLPTQEGLFAKRFDIDFDELQNSSLDIGTPVVVLYYSADHHWLYVESSASNGWVRAQDVAVAEKDEIKDYLSRQPFIVVTASKADIFLNNGMTEYYGYVRMGTKFPMAVKAPSKMRVLIPVRRDDGKLNIVPGYMNLEDVDRGYLSYTPRHVIKQAFKLLNAPYGWGGMYGEQDCSAFLQEIFATVGISLPRDSKDQAKVGKVLAEFDEKATDQQKLKALREAIAGAAVLPMKGHIMLYLGMIDGRPYAIHAVWGYREPNGKEDRVRVLNRVIVSDLSLGEGSKKGSLLKRLNAVRFIGN